MTVRPGKRFAMTASRQDDVRKKFSVPRIVCVGMLVALVVMLRELLPVVDPAVV